MENDQSLFTEYAIKTGEFIAKDLETFGEKLASQNLTEYQKIEATVARLTAQIEHNQALAQAYLQKAVSEIGQDSKAAKMLTDTALQQTQVVNWLKGLSQDAIQTASTLETTLIDGKTLKIIGEAGGAFLDATQIIVKLAQGDNTGVIDDAAGMLGGMVSGAIAIAMIPPAWPVGVIAGLVAVATGIGSTTVSDLSKQLEWGAKLIDFVSRNLINPLDDLNNLSDAIANLFNASKRWTWPRDPIILDLDGDGLETVGLASNVYFDHDGDGVLTKTGWVNQDDALLVWDRNANGSIDTGAELFGDFTELPNGTLAPNGFAALAALDLNGDGVLDANDPAFAELKLWRDADQNGITGQGELITLADAGIVSLNLANTLKNQRLSNGNTLSREGSFTRTDGSSSAMGEFKLAADTFSTRFAEVVDVPDALKSLPTMQGAGKVRESLPKDESYVAKLSGAIAGQDDVWRMAA